MTSPCLIINDCKVPRKFFQLVFLNAPGRKVRIPGKNGVTIIKFLLHPIFHFKCKANLVKEIFKAIFFKQLLVIRGIVIHAIHRRFKSFNKQSPPAVSFPEIDWAIHGLHSFLHQPMLCHIKQHIRGTLIIGALKKTDTSHGHLIALILVFFVCESCNPAD